MFTNTLVFSEPCVSSILAFTHVCMVYHDGINVIKKSKYFREGKEWVANLIEQEFNIEINDSIFNLK